VESSNLRAQAVEVFTNMLSEMRAYGQGVVVAEQIPSKITPDVLKNSNLKVVHRLTARDDRESLGYTTNLTLPQMTHLGTLPPGMASVYAEGDDHAYLVQVSKSKDRPAPLNDDQLRASSPGYASVGDYHTICDFAEYGIPCGPFGSPDRELYLGAGLFLDTERRRQMWGAILMRVLQSLLVARPAQQSDGAQC
jgi:hypothetical protein